jgi:hypothetical protein
MPSSLLVNLPAALAYHTDKGCCDHACQHSIDSACGISAGYMPAVSVERAIAKFILESAGTLAALGFPPTLDSSIN